MKFKLGSPALWSLLKSKLTLFLLILSLVGCDNLKKIIDGAESHPKEQSGLPSDYTIEGITKLDYQIIYEVRTLESIIEVEVKIPDATEFRKLNDHEFHVYYQENGGVRFQREAVEKDGIIYIKNKPCAPKGTHYKIRSILINQ